MGAHVCVAKASDVARNHHGCAHLSRHSGITTPPDNVGRDPKQYGSHAWCSRIIVFHDVGSTGVRDNVRGAPTRGAPAGLGPKRCFLQAWSGTQTTSGASTGRASTCCEGPDVARNHHGAGIWPAGATLVVAPGIGDIHPHRSHIGDVRGSIMWQRPLVAVMTGRVRSLRMVDRGSTCTHLMDASVFRPKVMR